MDFIEQASQFAFVFKNIPKVNEPWPLIILIVNIIFPGIGTIIAAFLEEDDDKMTFNAIFGLIQFITAICCIGWILSIFYGYIIYKKNTGTFANLPSSF
ncbi:hypothetical protein ABK040_013528 [Willaertia magna]